MPDRGLTFPWEKYFKVKIDGQKAQRQFATIINGELPPKEKPIDTRDERARLDAEANYNIHYGGQQWISRPDP